ncbi:MAG: type I CRISPR-associated protein Cas7 [Euryarchaeota archaeon]|nr:type I CRISPR-associated protein Cas7 [Euryarchaeota archaeon]
MNYNGIVVVNAKNANFNAGFDGLPRRLPTGRIFATDKALKYCIREYLSKNEPVFVQRTKEFRDVKDGARVERYLTLKENYLKKCNKEEMPKDEGVIINDLKGFIDIRLFGVVFAVDSNISMTGPCQINYGINRFEGSNIFSSEILSPYRNPNEKSKDAQQTTIGEESRADNVYYVYDICLNMNSAERQGIEVTDDDIAKLKNTLKYAVGNVTSTTMFGCETVSMLWFKNNDDRIFNNLNSLVEIYESDDGVVVDYSKVMKLVLADIDIDSLEEYNSKVQNIIPKQINPE